MLVSAWLHVLGVRFCGLTLASGDAILTTCHFGGSGKWPRPISTRHFSCNFSLATCHFGESGIWPRPVPTSSFSDGAILAARHVGGSGRWPRPVSAGHSSGDVILVTCHFGGLGIWLCPVSSRRSSDDAIWPRATSGVPVVVVLFINSPRECCVLIFLIIRCTA